MMFKPRYFTMLLVAAAAAAPIALAPIAAAAPVTPEAGDESASATIGDLKTQGYDVQINWVDGVSTMPLDECSVTGIDNDNSAPSSTSLRTVYVDVSCPDDGDGTDD